MLLLLPWAQAHAQTISLPNNLGDKARATLSQAKKEAAKLEASLRKLEKSLDSENARLPEIDLDRARKTAGKLLSPKRLGVVITASADDAAKTAERMRRYLAKEASANPALLAKLQRLRAQIVKKNLSFSVGVTSVSDKPIANITGIYGEPDLEAARAQNRQVAEGTVQRNLVQATMRARAMPPRHADSLADGSDDEEDAPRAAAENPIVQPDTVEGSKGGTYPSSRFPSVSSPAFSWRDRASPAKSQEECGACWAFANAAAYEVQQRLWNDASLDISEQQLVNCVPPSVASGNNCEGQWPEVAWKYLQTHGAAQESKVPYRAAMQSCDLSQEESHRVERWSFVGQADPRMPTDEEIKLALVSHGPVVATVRVTEAMQNYIGGVFDERDQGPINHAITIMGWDDAKGAWHVLNSWGGDWGEEGYVWVKYGSNRIGAYGTWAEPNLVKRAGSKSFASRVLRLTNQNDVPVVASVRAEVYMGKKWLWFPTDKAGKPTTLSIDIPARGSVEVVHPVTKKALLTRSALIWGGSRDGKVQWTANRDTTVTTVPQPYPAASRERYEYFFGKPDELPVNPDALWSGAHALRKAKKYDLARGKLDELIARAPHDPRVHAARYWLGWTFYKEKAYWDVADAMYAMVSAAPESEKTLGQAFHYTGLSYLKLGYCGYAMRNLEVVAYGDLKLANKWTDSAKSWIKKLNKDDGALCANWD